MQSIYLILFLVGLAFGSFASTIIHRLHTRERGIFLGRSKCPKCATPLGARDLVPLLSYFINRLKCRFCKEPISFRYPLLEMTMAGVFLLTAILIGLNDGWTLLFYLTMSFAFVLLFFYDWLFQEVPDSVALPAFGLAVLFALITKTPDLKNLIMGVLVPTAFFGALFWGSKGKWLGGGDVRIGALMGALLGWPEIIVGLFFGYLLGAIYSLIGILTKKLNRKSHIPFAPFLLTGTYITVFWGEEIMNWYAQLT